MAYRFNPPPNWPIEDANWTPPPGWQPDPAWGPAPDGWNFWVHDQEAPAPAAPASDTDSAPLSDEPTAREPAPAAEPVTAKEPTQEFPQDEAPQLGDDSDTRLLSEQDHPVGAQPMAEEPAAVGHPVQEPAVVEPTEQDMPKQPESSVQEPAEESVRDSGVEETAAASIAAAAASTGGRHRAEVSPEDDAQVSEASTDVPDVEPTQPLSQDAPEGKDAAAATQEYTGPDLQEGLHEPAPYEREEAAQPSSEPETLLSSPAPAYGQDSAPAAPAYGAYGSSPAPAYGQDSASAAPAYGAYGSSPAAAYGQDSASAAPAYGQSSPADGGYGAAYGQNSAPDNSSWTPAGSEGNGDNGQKKGLVARFWWVGCILLVILALILAVAGIAIYALSGGSSKEAGPTASQSTDSPTEEPSESPSDSTETESGTPSEENSESPTEQPSDSTEEPSESPSTPVETSTVPAGVKPVNISGFEGKGTARAEMKWVPHTDLKSIYPNREIKASPYAGGAYLVLTVELTGTEGTTSVRPYNFQIVTPYGGKIEPSAEIYSLKASGIDGPRELKTGEKHTLQLLYEVEKAGGMKMQYDAHAEKTTWPVPAK